MYLHSDPLARVVDKAVAMQSLPRRAVQAVRIMQHRGIASNEFSATAGGEGGALAVHHSGDENLIFQPLLLIGPIRLVTINGIAG